jgi:hypothetical protein
MRLLAQMPTELVFMWCAGLLTCATGMQVDRYPSSRLGSRERKSGAGGACSARDRAVVSSRALVVVVGGADA